MQNGAINNTTRGGQILLHDLHMMGQVLYKALLWLLPIGILILIGWFVFITEPNQRAIGRQWLWAEGCVWVDGKYHQQVFTMNNGHAVKVYSLQIIKASFIQETISILKAKLKQSAWVGTVGYGMSVITVLWWL